MIRFPPSPRDHFLVLEEALARAFAQLAFVEHLLEDGCHGLKVVGIIIFLSSGLTRPGTFWYCITML